MNSALPREISRRSERGLNQIRLSGVNYKKPNREKAAPQETFAHPPGRRLDTKIFLVTCSAVFCEPIIVGFWTGKQL